MLWPQQLAGWLLASRFKLWAAVAVG